MFKNLLNGLTTNVLLLGLVSLLTDISSEMILAIFPFFITSIGGTGFAIGLIGGIGDSLSSILKLFSGYWSDKIGKRKAFAFYGYLISTIGKIFFPFATSWVHILILRPIERIGKGLRSAPRDTLISVGCDGACLGRAFGFHRAMDSLGAFLGSGISFVLFYFLGFNFKVILLIAGFFGFFALIPFIWIKEKSDNTKNKTEWQPFKITLKGLPPIFKKYLFATFIFGLGNFTYMFFILKTKDSLMPFFSVKISESIPILLYCVLNIIYATISMPAGILSDKIGRKKSLQFGYLIYSLTCLGFFALTSLVAMVMLFIAYGISLAFIEGIQRAFVSDLIDEKERGTAMGAFHALTSVAVLLSGLVAGLLWNLGTSLPFLFGAILSGLAVITINSMGLEKKYVVLL